MRFVLLELIMRRPAFVVSQHRKGSCWNWRRWFRIRPLFSNRRMLWILGHVRVVEGLGWPGAANNEVLAGELRIARQFRIQASWDQPLSLLDSSTSTTQVLFCLERYHRYLLHAPPVRFVLDAEKTYSRQALHTLLAEEAWFWHASQWWGSSQRMIFLGIAHDNTSNIQPSSVCLVKGSNRQHAPWQVSSLISSNFSRPSCSLCLSHQYVMRHDVYLYVPARFWVPLLACPLMDSYQTAVIGSCTQH